MRNASGIEVCLSHDNKSFPHCPHGPTLMFERFIEGKGSQKFYACSACRDRKTCSFYQIVGSKVSNEKKLAREEFNKSQQPRFSHAEHRKRTSRFMKEKNQQYCHQCNLLILKTDDHQDHSPIVDINPDMLRSPTNLLFPAENNKKNAQYFFASDSVQFILSTLSELKFKKVLCIGAPRIHEAIKTSECRIFSHLLDMDHRYEQFYDESEFSRYNMFNHHFFNVDVGASAYEKFLEGTKDDELILVVDPPFGGLVDVLGHTFHQISNDWRRLNSILPPENNKQVLPAFWFFPYFMESRIKASQPKFNMLDYQVNYSNHERFQEGQKGRKHGSPVRIFTNLPMSEIKLPEEEGYRYCSECDRYVAKTNQHCKICQTCPSKDGRQYQHCELCDRCVKPSYKHCSTCQVCTLPEHDCNRKDTAVGCHLCGDKGHKRRECPKKNIIFANRKRQRKQGKRPNKKKSKLA